MKLIARYLLLHNGIHDLLFPCKFLSDILSGKNFHLACEY